MITPIRLTIPNLPIVVKCDPKLGEALKAVEAYINTTTVPDGQILRPSGNQVAAPPSDLVNPTVVGG